MRILRLPLVPGGTGRSVDGRSTVQDHMCDHVVVLSSTRTCAALKVCAFVTAMVGCATDDDRPLSLAYVTETVLTPYCSLPECHSSLRRQSGYVFDSVAATQISLKDGDLVDVCDTPPCYNAPGESYLLTVITNGDTHGHRMPLDQPLPNLDSVYIARWITAGAPGYTP
jgi:hypothetical protein